MMDQNGFRGVLNAWRKFGALGFAENLLLRILSLFFCGRIEHKLLLFKNLAESDFDFPAETQDAFIVRKIVPEETGWDDSMRLKTEPDHYAAFGAFTPDGELAAEGWICFKTFGWRGSDDFGGGRELEAGDAYFSRIGRRRNIADEGCISGFCSSACGNALCWGSAAPLFAWTATTAPRGGESFEPVSVSENRFSS